MPAEKVLYLVRHAEAEWPIAEQHDPERELTPAGMKDTLEMGQRFKAGSILPDLLLCSPARRAIQTAEQLAGVLAYPLDNIVLNPAIYEASISELLEVIRQIEDQHNEVMLVGHNPSLTWVINKISSGNIANAPPCAVATLTISSSHWRDFGRLEAALRNYDTP